jgi:hypothetical protein
MSVENARLAYPLLVQITRELGQLLKDRKPAVWISYDEFCGRCKEVGLKETPRTIVSKVLKPVQAACLEHGKPDLSALIIQKPRARSDFGNLLRPSDSWWEPYIERGDVAEAGDVDFWFVRFKEARDHEDWPEAPFF